MTKEQQSALTAAIVVIVIQIAATFGLQIDEITATTLVGAIITILVTAFSIWHNFNLTKAAGKGQEVTDVEKAKEKGDILPAPDGLDTDTSAIDEAEDETDSDELEEEDQ